VRPEGYEEAEAIRRVDRVYDNLKEVFRISREEGLPTYAAADRLAELRLAEARART
jgi:leucine dehydrogenase